MLLGRGIRRLSLVATLGGALSACVGVSAYRSLSGLDKNDPDPTVTPYSKNLADSEAASYPNLASVPPPPVSTSTAAEREQLAKSLMADRANAEKALASAPKGPTPPTSSPPDKGTKVAAAATIGAPLAPETLAVPPPPPPPQITPVAPVAPSPAAVAAAPVAPAAAPPAPAPVAGNAASSSSLLGGKQQPGQANRRLPGEPPEPAPLDAALQIPELKALPAPERPQTPPPPPRLGAAPAPAPAASLPTVASAGLPAPPPPVPNLPPPPPPPTPVAAKPEPKRPPTGVTVAAFELPSSAGQLSADDRARVAQVAATYREKAGTVRIVAYTSAGAPGVEQLNSYRAALDRAQLVAAALKDAGVPANKIQSEATPGTAGRVDVQLLP